HQRPIASNVSRVPRTKEGIPPGPNALIRRCRRLVAEPWLLDYPAEPGRRASCPRKRLPGGDVNRRAFVSGSLLALAAPLAAEAQQTKVYRIGALLQGTPLPGNPPGPLRLAMRELGYIEGQNLIVDFRWGEGRNDFFPRLAAELVALKPDAIFADSTPAALAAKRATATIPIVIHNVSDPVGSGLVVSLAHPGGNVTGVTDFGSELAVKGLELLHTIVPKAARIAVLMSDNPVHPSQLRLIQDAAQGF